MRVLHVITGLGVGGAELQLRAILQHTRHDADVVSLYNPGDVAKMLVEDGVYVRDLGMSSNTQIGTVWRLRDLIREGGYEVVHTHLYRGCVYGRVAARLAGTRVIVSTEHSIGETHLERRRMNWGVRALYLATEKCADATIAVSDTVAQRLSRWGLPAHKVQVIPNGVDFDRVAFDPIAGAEARAELGLGPDDYVIGVLGRLDTNKRFDLVIRAASTLLGGRAKLLIVGDGPDHERLAGVARESGVDEHVVFAGQRHDVAATLSALDLFVAASEQETFGLSVLEALGNGVPVLYTTCPALRGVVTARARQVSGEVDALRREMGVELRAKRAREDVPAIREHYGIQAVASRIDDLYTALGAQRSRRNPLLTRQDSAVGNGADR